MVPASQPTRLIALFSDLHLAAAAPEKESLFVDLLRKLRTEEKITDLWLLGDIYDLLVGSYPFWVQSHARFFDELASLVSAGVRVVWFEGNHDFDLRQLLEPRGIQVVDEDLEVMIAGKRLYLAHGDLVNRQDLSYLRWRALTRSTQFKKGLNALPERARERLLPFIGRWMSDQSRKRGGRPRDTTQTRSIYREFARAKWTQGFDGVILGHSHVDEELRSEDGRFYLNLGSWVNDSPRFALWQPESQSFPKVVFS
jgi:UDP-2,3-diacylglucosamine hydrolase